MKKYIYILLLFGLSTVAAAQQGEWIKGSVTFTSAANVYVRFDNTAGISEGDTLYAEIDGKSKAALVVKKIYLVVCDRTH